jgi:ABC-type nickel/cobalt efflux system permease component RcnA
MDASNTARMLSEENSSLAHASIGKIISTGLLLGIVHVMTGPDHLSALAAMSNGGSWRAFTLGLRWGCGHSTGLIIMTVIFFAAGQTIDLDATEQYLNYVVGVFMIALGLWTGKSVYRKYHLKLEKKAALIVDEDAGSRSCVGGLKSGTNTPTVVSLKPEQQPTQVSTTVEAPVPSSPTGSYALMINGEGDAAEPPTPVAPTKSKDEQGEEAEPQTFKQKYCSNMNFENPLMQKVAALCVGIVHGIAGPGGILGVLPAVVLNNWGKSTAYLASFCLASIFIMGVFAAIYGEVTRRLGGNTPVMDYRVGMCSSAFSFIIGCLWIILQSCGVLDAVFG